MKNDTNLSVCTSKWTRPCGSSIWEPDIYPSREVWDAYVAREQNSREKAEEERCKNLRVKMEEAICRSFSGEELIKIQPYKEAIFAYLKENLNYGMENSSYDLGRYIGIYYKHLAGKQISLGEVEFLQSNSRTFDNGVTKSLIARYFECERVLEIVSIEIGMTKEDLIKLIESDSPNQPTLDEFEDKVVKLFASKKNNNPYKISAPDFYRAIKTIRALRNKPNLMGLTYDEMHLRMDGQLPPLRKSTRY